MIERAQPIRIVSDGTARGTRVLLPNGETMPGLIKEVRWEVSATSQRATATIVFARVEVEVRGALRQGARFRLDPQDAADIKAQLGAIGNAGAAGVLPPPQPVPPHQPHAPRNPGDHPCSD